MAESYWKTGTGRRRRQQVRWPSLLQILRQVGLAVLITVFWGGAFFGFLRFTGGIGQVETSSMAEPAPVAVEVAPSDTPTLSPTNTPTPIPTATSTSTPLPAAEVLPADTTASPTAEPVSVEPSPTPTETPTLEPTPTETPLPPTNTPAPVDDETAEVSFSREVFPIIERRCIKCHGGPKDDGTLRMEEGLDMRSYSSLLEGSWNGPVIEPGNAEQSFLVKQIVEGEMPKKEPRLLPGEIRLISEWIEAGAPDN